jgi:secreted trypsin-like serine protease
MKNFEGGEVHEVKEIINHPWFNPDTYDYDCAILKLATSIKIDDRTKQEITLPYLFEALPEKTAVLVSGWGN